MNFLCLNIGFSDFETQILGKVKIYGIKLAAANKQGLYIILTFLKLYQVIDVSHFDNFLALSVTGTKITKTGASF